MRARVNKGITAAFAVLLVAAMGLPACGKQEEAAPTEEEAAVEQTEATEEPAAEDEGTELTIDDDLQSSIMDASKVVIDESTEDDAEDELDDLPEFEGDELDDVEVPEEIGEAEETTDKAGMVAIATSGVGLTVPTYWHPAYDESIDTAAFASDRYDLAGYITTDSRSNYNGNITNAASQHVRGLVNKGMFDKAYIQESGTLSSANGTTVGSYVGFVGEKGSEQYACETLFILGRTKVSNVYIMFNLRDANANTAANDFTNALNSLGYSTGETI